MGQEDERCVVETEMVEIPERVADVGEVPARYGLRDQRRDHLDSAVSSSFSKTRY